MVGISQVDDKDAVRLGGNRLIWDFHYDDMP
jgi:hypothetical protein